MLVRTAADFDNFRKRTRRELEDARRGGREDLLKEMLPVFDNLERAIQSALKAADVKAVADGLGMILKQFDSTLGRAGIQRVVTIGTMFDPSQHEAIQQMETDEHPPGTVVAEVQPGYKEGRAARPRRDGRRRKTQVELESLTDGESHRHRPRHDELMRRGRRSRRRSRQARRSHHPERGRRAHDAVGRGFPRERASASSAKARNAGGDQRDEHRLRGENG